MFKTEKPAFHAALASVIGVVNRSAKIPSATHVLVEAEGDGLSLTATRMDIQLTTRFAALVDPGFEPFTAPAHMVQDAVKSFDDGAEIRVEQAADTAGRVTHVLFRSGRSRLKLPVLPASDFPKLDAGTLSHEIGLGAESLTRALRAVLHAVCQDATRHYLVGAHLSPASDGLTLVASDGRRLAVRFIPAIDIDDEENLAAVPPVTIPTKAAEEALKLIAGTDNVEIGLSREKMRLSAGDTVMIAKLIDGVFPPFRQVVPDKETAIAARFSAAALSGAIRRVMIVTPDAGNGVAFRFATDTLRLSTRDIQTGEGEDEIPCEAGDARETGYHGEHMREALEHAGGDTVEMLISEGAGPTLLHVPGDEKNYTILMPLQVKGARAS